MSFTTKFATYFLTAGACVGSVSHWLTGSSPSGDSADLQPVVASSGREMATVAVPTIQKLPVSEDSVRKQTFLDFQKKLAEAEAAVSKMSGYTAVLEREEEADGELQEAESIDVKVRNEPFSVYMNWHDHGKEVLFVEGQNDNCLIARHTKGLAAMSGVWRLPPDSRLALKNCRYPVTEVGLHKLLSRVANFYNSHPELMDQVKCRETETQLDDLAVYQYEVDFPNRTISPDYSRSRCYFDKTTGILIGIENYGWVEDSPELPLVEKYVYRNLKADVKLVDSDFDESNPEYAFSGK